MKETLGNAHLTADEKTMELIAQRVADYKKNQQTSQHSTDDMNTHIEALSSVFELNKNDVKQIASDVLYQQQQQQTFKDKLYDGIITYSKEVIIAIVVVLVVAFLLLGRSVLTPANRADIMANTTSSADFSHFKKKAALANVMMSIMPIKIMLSEYYMNEGKYPQRLDEIGLDQDEMGTGKGINALMLSEKGAILVKVDESIGEDVIVKISPKMTMGGTQIEWQCQTNFSGYMPNCKKMDATPYLEKFH